MLGNGVDSSRHEVLPALPNKPMKFSLPRIKSRLQSVLIFVVFLIFIANAVGLTSFEFSFGQDIAINAQVANDLLSGRF